ncbi:zinc ribbon domain-containing protein [Rhodohalobacter sulfatireducens]|uniref:Zinc ribbon domain-containing protein n=1 Tax=Rhodohalobacter sulfatireducens TaxID=2911366 RepID=A0ABS9KHR9_9BACT|nr:zinc ribbon domain-containing protein [Rhodohalobacter sulfatireducens]MCG2590397.1 zinc ribbon domain-containing protein [Rhodohalobacter sulfatireducens]
MALVNCKECEREISSDADTCPHCGYSIKKEREEKESAIGCLIVVFIIIAGFYFWPESSSNEKPWNERDNSTMAYIMAENWVKDRLISPSTAEFPGTLEYRDHISRLPDQIYEIDSYVDSQNQMGAMVRTPFFARIQQTSEDNWKLLELRIE